MRFRSCPPSERTCAGPHVSVRDLSQSASLVARYQVVMMTNPGDMPLSYQILPAVDAAKVEDGGSLDLGDEVGKLRHQILRNVNITFSVCFENYVHNMGTSPIFGQTEVEHFNKIPHIF